MADNYAIEHFEADLIYWKEWVSHEEQALASCPQETKKYIEHRLAVGKRNIQEIETALEVFKSE